MNNRNYTASVTLTASGGTAVAAEAEKAKKAFNGIGAAAEEASRKIEASTKQSAIAMRQLPIELNNVVWSIKAGASVFAGFAVAQLAAVMSIKDVADETGKLSQRLGISTEKLSEMRYMMQLSNVSLGEMTSGMNHLANKMQDALAGDRQAASVFKSMSVSLRDANGQVKSLDTVFAEVSDRVSRYADGANKTALANDVFGRGIGERLIPMLNNGSAGLRGLSEEARKLSAVFDEDLIRQSGNLNDNFTRLSFAAESLKIRLASDLMPVFGRLAEDMALAAKNSNGLFEGFTNFATRGGWTGNVHDKIVSLRKEISELQSLYDEAAPTADLRAKIEARQRELNYNLERQRAMAMERSGSKYLDARDLMLNGPKPDAPVPSRASREPTSKVDGAGWAAHDLSREMAEEMRYLFAFNRAREAMQETTRNLFAGFARDNVRATEAVRIMPAAERELANSLRQVEERASAAREQLSHKAAALKDDAVAQAALRVEIANVTTAEERQRGVVRELYEEQQRLNGSWEFGARSALQNYLDSVTDTATAAGNAFARAFNGMEDSLVNFVKTGKLDFKSLADSIISDLIRIQVRESVTGPLAKTLSSVDWSGALKGLIPSFDVGTSYVPQDTLAFVHKGERILTADENRRGFGASGVTNVSIVVNENGGQTAQGDSRAAMDLGNRLKAAVMGVLIDQRRPGGLLAT